MKNCSVVDLFCGVGGLSYGFKLSGFNIAAGIDADPDCKYAYETNNGAPFHHKWIEDVNAADINEYFSDAETDEAGFRALIGCAPCQPYSTYARASGKNESPEGKKKKGGKWQLLSDFADLIIAVKPDVVSMENVVQLRTFKKGVIFDDFNRKLSAAGYDLTDHEVFCPDYGVPQERTRLVVFASKHGDISLSPPTHVSDEYVSVEDAIGEMPPIKHGESHEDDAVHKASGLRSLNLSRIRHSKPGGTWRDWPEELVAACHKKDSGSTYTSVYGRMEYGELAPTLTTQCYGYGNGRFGHPVQDRAISLREAALLQSFPPEYELVEPGEKVYMSTVGRHVGNAVPPLLGKAIADSIAKHLEEVNSDRNGKQTDE